jgi:uncharacterized protein (DUF305 family)
MYQMANHTMATDQMHMDNGLMQSMNKMMTKMSNMQMTGDFDLEFANMMIIHHQAAIDMSKVEIAKGNDEQIKDMARNIVRKQKSEIKKLQSFVKYYELLKTEHTCTKIHKKLIKIKAEHTCIQIHDKLIKIKKDIMTKIMEDMMIEMKSMRMTGDIDKDFARMMIVHHIGAIKMAKNELLLGSQIQLIKMAAMMIKDQKYEINEFKLWLSEQ